MQRLARRRVCGDVASRSVGGELVVGADRLVNSVAVDLVPSHDYQENLPANELDNSHINFLKS